MENDRSYFSRRASEESAAADRAASGKARDAHLELARRYRDIAHSAEVRERRADMHMVEPELRQAS